MTGQSLILLLEKMLKLHSSLLLIANKKTLIIKDGNISSLNDLMKEEQKHISAIQILELKRSEFVSQMTGAPAGSQEATLSASLSYFEPEEQTGLTSLQKELGSLLSSLKETNALNQQLLEQSMQFVSLNMDLLQPQNDSYNYGNKGEDHSVDKIKPIFDSQA